MERRPWRNDGKRYVVALQDTIDQQCYKDFFESDTLIAAKEKADEAVIKHGRSVLVFDREYGETSYKKVIDKKKEPEVKKSEVKPSRGKIKPETERKIEKPKKEITKDDYF